MTSSAVKRMISKFEISMDGSQRLFRWESANAAQTIQEKMEVVADCYAWESQHSQSHWHSIYYYSNNINYTNNTNLTISTTNNVISSEFVNGFSQNDACWKKCDFRIFFNNLTMKTAHTVLYCRSVAKIKTLYLYIYVLFIFYLYNSRG